uniref:F-box domain-containing protein n=1 Tax=Caenorhabditis tropicalis TaxID=1561998 RepID=A0A1I7TQ52_9PELO
MSTEFRLFEVTDVVFDEILIQLELNEIFNLSLCSLKTLNIIRRHMRKSIKYPLFVDTKDNYEMSFGFIRNGKRVIMMSVRENEMSDERREIEKVNLGGQKTQISRYDDHIAFFGSSTDDMHRGYLSVLKQIIHVFPEDIHTLHCDSPWPFLLIPLKREYLHMLYVGSEEYKLYWNLVNFEFKNSAITRGLQLCSYVSKYYDFTLTRNYEYIRVERAPEAQLDDVLKVARRSKEVIFDQSLLTSQCPNIFFNLWLENCIDGLKFLSVEVFFFDESSAFKRIEHRISDTTEEVNYKSYTGEIYRLSPGKRLRRDDGVNALFYYNPFTNVLNFGILTC